MSNKLLVRSLVSVLGITIFGNVLNSQAGTNTSTVQGNSAVSATQPGKIEAAPSFDQGNTISGGSFVRARENLNSGAKEDSASSGGSSFVIADEQIRVNGGSQSDLKVEPNGISTTARAAAGSEGQQGNSSAGANSMAVSSPGLSSGQANANYRALGENF